jgi:CBS domain-containing protein
MKVREVMTSAKVTTARPHDTLPLAAQMMVSSNVRHLPVVHVRTA